MFGYFVMIMFDSYSCRDQYGLHEAVLNLGNGFPSWQLMTGDNLLLLASSFLSPINTYSTKCRHYICISAHLICTQMKGEFLSETDLWLVINM